MTKYNPARKSRNKRPHPTAGKIIRGRVNRTFGGTVWLRQTDSRDIRFTDRDARELAEGDEVEAKIVGGYGKSQAHLKSILKRGRETFPARLIRRTKSTFLQPLSPWMPDRVDCHSLQSDAEDGDIVIAHWQRAGVRDKVRLTAVLGKPDDPQVAFSLAVASWEVPDEWPRGVRQVREKLAGMEEAILADKARKDLTQTPFVTIDGEDSKDFDDAVWCEALQGGGWHLQVAIADVSAYVAPGSALDTEAYRRGTSAYFQAETLPMLPLELSADLCSLVQDKKRPAVVCSMQIAADGAIHKYEFFRAVICSARRLTYGQVQQELQTEDGQRGPMSEELHRLDDVSAALDEARAERGALEMHTSNTPPEGSDESESQSVIGEEPDLGPAHRLVENAMLAANVCAAKELAARGSNAPLRQCPQPSPDKWNQLVEQMQARGIDDIGSHPERQDYTKLLERIRQRDDRQLLTILVIRSMMQAEYVVGGEGHFPLALEHYTHFTSPIRRYPDLLVHRLLTDDSGAHKPPDALACKEMSERERRAEGATKQEIRHLRCLETLPLVGQRHSVELHSVKKDRIVVRIEQTGATGVVQTGRNSPYRCSEIGVEIRRGRDWDMVPLGGRMTAWVVEVVPEEQEVWLKELRLMDDDSYEGSDSDWETSAREG